MVLAEEDWLVGPAEPDSPVDWCKRGKPVRQSPFRTPESGSRIINGYRRKNNRENPGAVPRKCWKRQQRIQHESCRRVSRVVGSASLGIDCKSHTRKQEI